MILVARDEIDKAKKKAKDLTTLAYLLSKLRLSPECYDRTIREWIREENMKFWKEVER